MYSWRRLLRDQIQPCNLCNFDETGFRVSIGGNKWVIITAVKRRVWSPSETSWKHVTFVEACNANGQHVEAMLIEAGKVLQERWFEGLSDNTLLGVTVFGYLDDELALHWIKHFERLTRPPNEEYRLLLCDNYGSNTFYDFLQYAQAHRVIVIGLRAHTSHFLQPLDQWCYWTKPLLGPYSTCLKPFNSILSSDRLKPIQSMLLSLKPAL